MGRRSEPSRVGPTPLERVRVLHVDDNPAVTELFAAYVGRHDPPWCALRRARTADEGLGLLRCEPFDCVVSDYSMPGRNGLEFLEQVRTERPSLPFVLFT